VCDLGKLHTNSGRAWQNVTLGVLQLCWGTVEIEDIDLVNFGWNLKYVLTYGIQTGTERRLDHSLGFGRS
jgi:hypothetical protein